MAIRSIGDIAALYEGSSAGRSYGKIDTPIMLLKSLLWGRRIVREHNIDIILAHGIRWAGLIGALIATFTRKPFIVFIHSTAPEDVKSRLLRFITTYAVRTACKVFFVSSGQARNYIKSFPIRASAVIGNPVDTETYRLLLREVSGHVVRIVFAGRPTPDKGFPLLLNVIEEISSVRQDVFFTILTDLRMLSAADEARLSKNIGKVELKHYQDKKEFARILKDCSFLISLSRFESFSYVIAEAMACGKPVLATSCDGPQELVDNESGILVPIDNQEETIKALLWMVDNYSRFRPERIRNRIVERYSFAAVQEKLLLELDAIEV